VCVLSVRVCDEYECVTSMCTRDVVKSKYLPTLVDENASTTRFNYTEKGLQLSS